MRAFVVMLARRRADGLVGLICQLKPSPVDGIEKERERERKEREKQARSELESAFAFNPGLPRHRKERERKDERAWRELEPEFAFASNPVLPRPERKRTERYINRCLQIPGMPFVIVVVWP